jgi:hypothetical protein
MTQPAPPEPAQVCFGLSQEQDRESCRIFLQLLGRPENAELLSGRLSSAEIDQLVELASNLLRTHLSRQEYHQVFLHKPGQNP